MALRMHEVPEVADFLEIAKRPGELYIDGTHFPKQAGHLTPNPPIWAD